MQVPGLRKQGPELGKAEKDSSGSRGVQGFPDFLIPRPRLGGPPDCSSCPAGGGPSGQRVKPLTSEDSLIPEIQGVLQSGCTRRRSAFPPGPRHSPQSRGPRALAGPSASRSAAWPGFGRVRAAPLLPEGRREPRARAPAPRKQRLPPRLPGSPPRPEEQRRAATRQCRRQTTDSQSCPHRTPLRETPSAAASPSPFLTLWLLPRTPCPPGNCAAGRGGRNTSGSRSTRPAAARDRAGSSPPARNPTPTQLLAWGRGGRPRASSRVAPVAADCGVVKKSATAVGRAGQGALRCGQGHWSLRVPARAAPPALLPRPAGLPGPPRRGPAAAAARGASPCLLPRLPPSPPLSLPPLLRPPRHPPLTPPLLFLLPKCARRARGRRGGAEQAAQSARPPPARRSSQRSLLSPPPARRR